MSDPEIIPFPSSTRNSTEIAADAAEGVPAVQNAMLRAGAGCAFSPRKRTASIPTSLSLNYSRIFRSTSSAATPRLIQSCVLRCALSMR